MSSSDLGFRAVGMEGNGLAMLGPLVVGGVAEIRTKNNERPGTLSSPRRPGSPPPELLTKENKTVADSCLWHEWAISTPEVPFRMYLKPGAFLTGDQSLRP